MIFPLLKLSQKRFKSTIKISATVSENLGCMGKEKKKKRFKRFFSKKKILINVFKYSIKLLQNTITSLFTHKPNEQQLDTWIFF